MWASTRQPRRGGSSASSLRSAHVAVAEWSGMRQQGPNDCCPAIRGCSSAKGSAASSVRTGCSRRCARCGLTRCRAADQSPGKSPDRTRTDQGRARRACRPRVWRARRACAARLPDAAVAVTATARAADGTAQMALHRCSATTCQADLRGSRVAVRHRRFAPHCRRREAPAVGTRLVPGCSPAGTCPRRGDHAQPPHAARRRARDPAGPLPIARPRRPTGTACTQRGRCSSWPPLTCAGTAS